MIINEIYPNSTVKQVIFQITFPNLFYLENRIGEIQEKIMEEFPKSNLLQKRMVRVKFGSDQPAEVLQDEPINDIPQKIWQFESRTGIKLNITSNSLDLSSTSHKTYNLGDDNNKKFRYTIEQVVGTFIDVSKLPIIDRIGLRYIDHCPVPSNDNDKFSEWYDSKLPLAKFQLADVDNMACRVLVKKGKYNLGYVETLSEGELILDFDGFATDIKANEYLKTTDELHKIIREEFELTTRADNGPLYTEHMNKQEGLR